MSYILHSPRGYPAWQLIIFMKKYNRFLLKNKTKHNKIVYQWNWKIELIRCLYYYNVLLNKEWDLYSATLTENIYGSLYIPNLQRIKYAKVFLFFLYLRARRQAIIHEKFPSIIKKKEREREEEEAKMWRPECSKKHEKVELEFKGDHRAIIRHILWIGFLGFQQSQKIFIFQWY